MDNDLKALLRCLFCFVSFPPVSPEMSVRLVACLAGCWVTWQSDDKKNPNGDKPTPTTPRRR